MVKPIDIEIKHSPKVEPLFTQHARYVVLYGGRGGSKSWEVAYFLVQQAMSQRNITILCVREKLNKIDDSVHKLLKETIRRMCVGYMFSVLNNKITCKATKSEFIYIGLQGSTADDVKGYENLRYCWCEEGQQLSMESITTTFPTVRCPQYKQFKTREDLDNFLAKNPQLNYNEYLEKIDQLTIAIPSEIIITFNPDNEDDPVYERFVSEPPDSCILININYTDNPNCPPDIKKEAADCKKRSIDEYNHVWLGMPKNVGMKIYASKFLRDVNVRKESRDQLLTMLRLESLGNFMAIDPHSKYFPFCLWLSVILDEHGEPEYIIRDEFPTYDYFGEYYYKMRKKRKLELSLLQLAQTIYGYDGSEYGLQINNRFADTRYTKGSGGENVMTNSVGMIETWKRPENGSFLLCVPPEKMIDIQQVAIKTDLDHNRNIPVGTFNKPKLTIAKWCKNTIDMFENHREDRDGKGEDEKRKEPSDTLRILYAGISGMVFKRKQVVNVGRRRGGSWMSR
jgi:hypothetical protein